MAMEDIENLFDKAVAEIERMLNTKTVVGEPITVEGNTLIPLVNVGFGFGVGKITDVLVKQNRTMPDESIHSGMLFGEAFITLGIFSLLAAVVQYW